MRYCGFRVLVGLNIAAALYFPFIAYQGLIHYLRGEAFLTFRYLFLLLMIPLIAGTTELFYKRQLGLNTGQCPRWATLLAKWTRAVGMTWLMISLLLFGYFLFLGGLDWKLVD